MRPHDQHDHPGRRLYWAGWGQGARPAQFSELLPPRPLPSPACCPGLRPPQVRPQLRTHHPYGKMRPPNSEACSAAGSPAPGPARGQPGQVGWPRACLGRGAGHRRAPVGTGAPRPGSQGRASQGLPRTSLPRELWPDPQGDQIDQQTAKAKASLPPCSSRKQPGPPSRPGGYPEPTPRGSRARGDQEDGGGAGGGRTPSGCGAHEQRAGLSLPGHLPAP